jgi:hypothetical protein
MHHKMFHSDKTEAGKRARGREAGPLSATPTEKLWARYTEAGIESALVGTSHKMRFSSFLMPGMAPCWEA